MDENHQDKTGSKLGEAESSSTKGMKNVDCSKLSEEESKASPTEIIEIILARCNCLIDQYLRWKKENHLRYVCAQGTALISTAAIPVVLLIPWPYLNIVGAALAALAASATGLMVINGWRENFIRYGYIYHMLQVEKYLYLTKATIEYWGTDPQSAVRNFAKRIEGLVTLDVTEWRTEMQRISERSQIEQSQTAKS